MIDLKFYSLSVKNQLVLKSIKWFISLNIYSPEKLERKNGFCAWDIFNSNVLQGLFEILF